MYAAMVSTETVSVSGMASGQTMDVAFSEVCENPKEIIKKKTKNARGIFILVTSYKLQVTSYKL
jgi:hypothetical protein